MGDRWLMALAVVVATAGLASAADSPPDSPPASPPASSDARFFGELAYKDIATAADAARALTILVSEGTRTDEDFAECKAYLRSRSVVNHWLSDSKRDDPADKGHLAALLCRALGIKGGLWMRLLGPLPRLALHECIYLNLMITGAEYEHVGGGELVGIIDRADRFRLKEAGRRPQELQGRPSGAAEKKP
jgi:hypothetical protein